MSQVTGVHRALDGLRGGSAGAWKEKRRQEQPCLLASHPDPKAGGPGPKCLSD